MNAKKKKEIRWTKRQEEIYELGRKRGIEQGYDAAKKDIQTEFRRLLGILD